MLPRLFKEHRIQGQIVAFLLLFSVILVTRGDATDPQFWLEKMNQAPDEVSYSGTFVYLHEGVVETMRVTRRVDDGRMRERLYSLSGSLREIIRDEEMVWCYLPDQKIGVHEYRQTVDNDFPKLLPDDLGPIEDYYDVLLGGRSRIADRMAIQVSVTPRDSYRYGYDLWADESTGLLLRADLKSPDKDIIEQYLFVEIVTEGSIPDSELTAITPRDALTWYGDTKVSADSEGGGGNPAMHWKVNDLPPGFMMARRIKRTSAMHGMPVEHYVYTDGLASISVFVEEKPDSSAMEGLSTMGAVNAYGRMVEGLQVTVVGEVPAAAVEKIAMSVEKN